MVSVDTNILVRLIANDEPVQVARARHIVDNNTVYIPMSVILECEWVLRFSYKLEREAFRAALETIVHSENVVLEDEESMSEAFRYYELGLDFADALHLALSKGAESLATFDRQFCRRASGLTACKVFVPEAQA